MSPSYYSIARATAMNYDVVALERHLNLRVSTACSLALFFALLYMLCFFIDLLNLDFKNPLLNFLLFFADFVFASDPLKLVIFLE